MIVAYPACGILAKEIHWEYVFYVPGAIAIVWGMFWLVFIVNTPRDSRCISLAELEFIEAETDNQKDGNNVKKKLPAPPIKQILCSKPFIVLAIAQMGNYWGYYTLMSGAPLY